MRVSFVVILRQHKLPATWDCSVAVRERSQVQLFICFWQAAKFIIETAAEARRMFGGKRRASKANTGFIHSACFHKQILPKILI